MQLYLESNYIKITKCDYYIEDTFAKKHFQNSGTEEGIINVAYEYKKSI